MLTAQEKADIRKTIRSGLPYTIETSTLPNETELKLVEVLELFLKDIGRESITDSLGFCVREMAVNAKKANTKRIYFQEKGLNINSASDYDTGMASFKKDTLGDISPYLDMMESQGFYIRVSYTMKGTTLVINIANNAMITKAEQIRVFDRITRSRSFKSLQDAMEQAIDETEGAGLGIIILILMLRKIGLDESSFALEAERDETIVRLSIPIDDIQESNLNTIAQEIVNRIDSLPQFPENIQKLQKMLANPNTQINAIARTISQDPALTAELLKLANSAAYVLPHRVHNIQEAVKIIGLKGLESLLYGFVSMDSLKSDGETIKNLWEHSFKVAFYAQQLASTSGRNDIMDDAFIGGILHDIGRILFAVIDEDLLKKISAFCNERQLPSSMLEELAAGFHNAEIGARIAEKWNFPPRLIQTIRHQHSPETAPAQFFSVAATVYLANALCEYQDGHLPFVFIDHGILCDFGIDGEETLAKRIDELSQAFTHISI
ncbi:MAG: HDOD domain-containing protein [Spirochaetaceae bacterium]|mgnify:CR=1 FL=1|nr:MAG: HDOD domain-containing protein [Spirochaetaceae bacterium]